VIALTLPAETWLHRWPAGVKLMLLAAASLMILPLHDPLPLAALTAAAALLTASLGRAALKRLALIRPLVPLIVILVAVHAVLGDVTTGLTVSLRIVLMIWLASLVTMTTRLDDMVGAIGVVLRPLRFAGARERDIALAVALVIRFTPYLFAEWRRLADTWRARTGRRPGWRLIAPFCVRVLAAADAVGEALTARLGEDAPRPRR